MDAWRDETDDDFIFAWKASKFITHWKRLSSDCASSLALLETRLKRLKKKVGPVLFQLPPNFRLDLHRLERFLMLLNSRHRYCFEFRHESWYDAAVLRLLANHNIGLCISDHHDAPAPWTRTANFVYIRGHGPTGRYQGAYAEKDLIDWSGQIKAWRRSGFDVYAYFDNDQKSAAPKDAARLQKLVAKEIVGKRVKNSRAPGAYPRDKASRVHTSKPNSVRRAHGE